MIVTASIAQAFLRLCEPDHRLSASIRSVTITDHPNGLSIIIQPQPGAVRWISRKLFKIARFLYALDRFKTITINGNKRPLTFLMEDLIATCPSIRTPPKMTDRRIRDSHYFRALIQRETKHCSAFVISTDGIYLDAAIHQGTISKIPPEAMIGKPIAQFAGEETAAYLMQQIQAACLSNEVQLIEYSILFADGKRRWYRAEVIPAPKARSAILFVNRIR